jgi:hypothetical protein
MLWSGAAAVLSGRRSGKGHNRDEDDHRRLKVVDVAGPD